MLTPRACCSSLAALLTGVLVLTLCGPTAAQDGANNSQRPRLHEITVPEEDRFLPFTLTIHRGDSVEWVNNDTDDHTVVSVDAFTTAGHTGTNHLLPAPGNNQGQPGRFRLRFHRLGTFVYYCRFHAHLDPDMQPVAPGPDGGIQDTTGNFGTPMMGTITVVP